MAESYKGLTIRIGGDATGLQKALRTATQASAGAGQELRKLKDAVKLDPGNVEAYTMQMGYMAEQAANTAMKLYQMREAAQQIAGSKFNLDENLSKPVDELVESMRQAHTEAAKAKTAYNQITDTVAEMHTTLSRYNEEEAKIGSAGLEKLSENLNIQSSTDQLKEFGQWVNDVYRDLEGVMQQPKRSVDEIIDEMNKLQTKFSETKGEVEKSKLAEQFEKLRKELVTISGLKISFAEGTTDFGSIDAALETLGKLMSQNTDEIDRFRARLGVVKSDYAAAMETLRAANENARLADLNVEIIRAQASIKNVAAAISSMKEPSDVLRGMYELTERTKALDEAYKSLTAQGRSLESAFSINPENTEAQTAAMKMFSDAEQVAQEKAASLQEQLDSYDTTAIDQYTDATKSAQQQLNEAALTHEVAAEKVMLLKGAIDATEDTMNKLANDAPKVAQVISEKFGGADGWSLGKSEQYDEDNIEAYIEALKELGAYMEQLAEEEAEMGTGSADQYKQAADALGNLAVAYENLEAAQQREKEAATAEERAKERKEVESLRAQIAEATGEIDKMRVAQQKLANSDITPKIDTTEIERLKDVKKDLEDYGSSVGQAFSGAANDIKVVTALTSDLESRAKSLMDAFQADPTNVNALELSVRATDEAMNGCKIRAAQLKEIIEQYTPDKIDEAAIATNTVGINAERAAFAVSEAFKAIDEAKKEADDLGKKLSEAMKSAAGSEGGADNPTVTALREQFEAATQKVKELEVAAQKALAAMDTANATAEVTKYREELAKAEQEMIKLAQTQATAFKEGAIADTFGAETKEMIDGLGTSLNMAVERAKAFDAALKVDPYNVELLAGKTQAYADVAVLAKQRTEAIKEAIANYDTSKLDALKSKYQTIEEAVRKTTKEYVNTEAAVKKAEGALESMLKDAGMEGMLQDVLANADAFENQLTPDIMKAVNALKDLIAKAQEAKGAMTDAAEADFYEKSAKGLADTAKTADLSDSIDSAAVMTALDKVASAAQRAGQAIVDSANTVDAAYRDMRKTVNGTEEEFESIKAAAIEFSQTHAVTADTLLEMEALGGQLGITTQMLDSGKTALQEFGEVAANLDIATDISANDIALKLGQITNVMSDLDFSTFENFADALVRLGNNVPATESAIMDVAQRIAAVANVTSMSTPQVLGWSAAIASTGTNAESAATSITKTITGIGQAVAEGGNKLQAFADIAGMTADEFKKKWETSSSDALEAFIVGLSKLTDPSTAAIEALDSVGISSVRQETALLALSQTVDNLGESVTMASDAFNGISDEWGNAGDAANEAQNKSEGFSGALAIMKNNAAALAQTLGDSLVEPIKLVSSLLKLLTDALNALPAPVKTIITVFGGATVAISAISPILQIAAKAMGGFIGTLANTHSIGQFVLEITGLGTAMRSAEANCNGLTTALSGMNLLKFAGISLAVTAIVALVSAIGDVIQQYKNLREAEDRLEASSKRLRDAAKGAASAEKELKDEIAAIHTTAEDATTFINNLAAAQERLAESFETQNYELQVDVSTAQEAFEHVQELMDKVSTGVKLNPFDQAELESSVAVLNETMGMSLEIIDASKASIKGMGDETEITAAKLKEMVDAEIASATRTLLVQQYVEAQQHMLDMEAKLDEAKENAKNNEAAYADALKSTGSVYSNSIVPSTRDAVDANLSYIRTTSGALASQTNLNKELETAQSTYDEAAATVEDLRSRLYAAGGAEDAMANDTRALAKALEEVLYKSEDMRSILRNMGEDLDEYDFGALAEDFANAGVTVENFGDITAAQLARIMTNYNGTASSIKRCCDEMGIALCEVADAAEESSARMRKATDEEYEHFKDLYDHLYTEQKRLRDDFYNDEKEKRDDAYEDYKDQLDDEYTTEKRRLEDIYNARKDTYDKDYDAAKSSLEKKYDDFKDELDDEYTTVKRHLDDVYDARKDEYDKEYDALKDALTKEYNAIKDAFDNEYDAYKKTLDKEYDAAKDMYDDIYDARKDELDKEYNAVKDALDKVYNAYKKTLDAEYNAAKDTYDAIYNARKNELDKEYDLYKKQLDKEYSTRKKELDAEYDVIKGQLDDVYNARKKELDKEYKAAQKASSKFLKQYKKDLDAQVDAFKKATDARVKAIEAERDAQKALVDEQTKAKTDEIDKRIAALKGETEAEAKEQRERERAEKIAELQMAVDNAKSRRTRAEAEKALSDYLREIELEDAKERREQLISELEDERDAIEERGDMRKEMLDEQYADEVDQYKLMRELQLEELEESLDLEYEKMQEAESERLEMLKESHSQILEALKEEQQGQLDLIKEAQSATLENLKEAQAAELEGLKEEHSAVLENLKEENESALAAIKEANDARLSAMKDDHTAQLEALKESHDTQLETLKDEHDAALEAIKDEQEAALTAMKDDQAAQLEAIKEDHDAQLEALKDDQEALLAILKRDNEDALTAVKREHDTRLEAMKDENDLALEGLKDDQEAQLLTLKREHEDGLEGVKRDHEARLEAMKEQDEADLLFLKRCHEDELETIKNDYDETLRGIKDGSITYEEAMAQITGQAIDDITSVTDTATTEVGDMLSDSSAAVDSYAENLKTRFAEIKAELEGGATQTETHVTKVSDILKGLWEDHKLDGETYVKYLSGMPTDLSGVFDQANISVETGLGVVAATMFSQGEIGLGQYLGVLNGMPGSTSSICNETSIAFANELGLLGPEANQKAADAVSQWDGGLAVLPNKTSTRIGEADKAITDSKIDSTASAKAKTVGEAFTPDFATPTQNALDDTEKKVTNWGTGNASNAAKGAAKEETDAYDENLKIKDKTEDHLEKTDDKAGKGYEKIEKTSEKGGKNATSSFESKFKEMVTVAEDVTRDVFNAVTDGLSDLPGELEKIGKNAGVGFKNGLANEAQQIYDTAQTIANGVAEIMRNTLSVHSPSRVTMKIGEYVTQGLAVGLENDADMAYRAAVAVANLTTKGYDRVMDGHGFAESMLDPLEDGLKDAADRTSKLASEYGTMVGSNFMEQLLWQIRRGEDEAVTRMAEMATLMTQTLKDGFDLHWMVDSAYEAMDRITDGIKRQQEYALSVRMPEYQAASNVTVNVTLSDVTIRETADIDKLAQRLAQRVEQVSRSRIGR